MFFFVKMLRFITNFKFFTEQHRHQEQINRNKLNINSDMDNRMNRLQEEQLTSKNAPELEPTLAAKSNLQL